MALIMSRNYTDSGQLPPPLPSRDGRTNMKYLSLDRGTNDINKLGMHSEAAPLAPSLTSIPKRNLTTGQSFRAHEPPPPPSRDHDRQSPNTQCSTLKKTQQSRYHQLPPVPTTSPSQLVAVPPLMPRINEVPPPLPERPHKMTDLAHERTHASTKPAAANSERNFSDRFIFHDIKEFPAPEPIEFRQEEKEIKTAKSTRRKNHQGHRTCSNLDSV